MTAKLKLNQRGVSHLMMLAILLVVAVISGVSWLVYKKAQQKKSKSDEQTTAVQVAQEPYKKGDLVVYYPNDWFVDESGANGSVVQFVNRTPDKAADGTPGTALIIVRQEKTDQELLAFAESKKQFISTIYNSVTAIEEKVVTGIGSDFHLYGYTYKQGDGRSWRVLQSISVKNGTATVIEAQALENAWDTYKKVFEDTLTKQTDPATDENPELTDDAL